jgi:hypothetical protein
VKSISKDPILKKGTIIGWDWWYVVIEIALSGQVHCICDNANNIYSFSFKEILETKDPREWILLQPEEFNKKHRLLIHLDNEYYSLINRELPYDVIIEALHGKHDDRFLHWRNS